MYILYRIDADNLARYQLTPSAPCKIPASTEITSSQASQGGSRPRGACGGGQQLEDPTGSQAARGRGRGRVEAGALAQGSRPVCHHEAGGAGAGLLALGAGAGARQSAGVGVGSSATLRS
eukprot:1145249-Pelagomonas_calceolata.AAC.4